MRGWIKAVLCCVILLIGSNVAALSAGASGTSPRTFDQDAEDCFEFIPAEQSVAGVTDDGREVVLDVHLVLDGVSTSRAAEVVQQAQHAFTPLRIKLQPTFQQVSFPPQKMAPEFQLSQPVPASDADYLMQKTKEAVGGARPANSDVVYLLTDDAITGGAAGKADCIGGVRYPSRAFGIGEEDEDWGGLQVCCTRTTAKIAAHEIAHLLGAHHHYANCAEGAAEKLDDPHLGTCTMMFNDVGLVNLRFSVLEAAVVRGHAIKFADRAPEETQPQPEPTEPQPEPTEPQPEPTE
ncbi:MAG: M12 family metallo-peptidase, partial [Actinomycetota bacterium]|nr:M12 family metallo-peptidase [Actinomycetota bacterium]